MFQIINKICPICKKSFLPSNSLYVYCSLECATISHKLKHRLSNYKWRETHRESYNTSMRILARKKYQKNPDFHEYQRNYQREYQRNRLKNNPEYHRKFLETQKKFRIKQRLQIINHYSKGTMKCACCGENNINFLTIDHINNDGNIQRKSLKTPELTHWIIKNNFPEGFQILCYNCNLGKAHHGGICPHKKII